MKAAIFQGVGKIGVGERPDPAIQEQTDAIVRVVLACVCGSDLWYYRGITPHPKGSIGHEFIGVAGSNVRGGQLRKSEWATWSGSRRVRNIGMGPRQLRP